ncbi:DUF5916 domain-containing protein [Flavobacterium sp. 5]|uniref:DUF5916 domain-containing protein n=1 Tax=Flavobacterium sp. 5 TaxID=2035199 RepID=UPI000C2C8548|nr:DUF5916 domain-containing protein [Flavobacterium sp. 5]PKB16071.1 carbohydrate binding protein with CBM9 domain [Flavobacterium sp. 5]
MKKHYYIYLLLFCTLIYGQKKSLQTKFTSEKITLDGKLDEAIWQSTPIATDFIMFQPDNGKTVDNNKRTEVRVLYDNEAIYISALMYDNEPNKILKEINKRDEFGTADFFGVFINGYNDGQQNFEFFVNAADGQADCLATDNNGEDYSWDAVWESKALITSFGWIVEMRIPYAALRFSNEKIQTWGMNFFREIRRDRQKYSWNFIDSKIGTITQQNGTMTGIENIKTPTRLFFLPYASFYTYANANQKTYGELKGGLDIKYGINDAFTLDAMLIPDFGQTKYDDRILNLSPFEQQFNENRGFFTEGTDLFSKGNLFYSRRIGGPPSYSPKMATNEEIIENLANVDLYNATKISGRTKGGLGIGYLNAVTKKTYATIRDTITQETRQVLVEPLTNYNVIVLDQRFHKNSSASFVNTNVTRDGSFRDGNVSALVWDLNTVKNTYNLSGNFEYSYVNDIENKKEGINTTLNFAETSGKYRYSTGTNLVTKGFDNNDLGINFETNYYSFYGNTSYRILNPTKIFNSFNTNINVNTQFQKETNKIQSNQINLNVNSNTKKNHYVGFGFDYRPFENYNYYEPRTDGLYSIDPTRFGSWFEISTNYNNKFAIDLNPSIALFGEPKRMSYGLYIGPRYRFNDHLALYYDFNFLRQNNNKGFVDSGSNNDTLPSDAIIYANRNVITYTNTLNGKYSLNSKMNFNLSARYYWSYTENLNFYNLEDNGRLSPNDTYTENQNQNLNTWNLDLSYNWWFAPGSQLTILYRNNAAKYDNLINKDFGNNYTSLLNNKDLSHVLSVSLKYFIDYNQVKNIL